MNQTLHQITVLEQSGIAYTEMRRWNNLTYYLVKDGSHMLAVDHSATFRYIVSMSMGIPWSSLNYSTASTEKTTAESKTPFASFALLWIVMIVMVGFFSVTVFEVRKARMKKRNSDLEM